LVIFMKAVPPADWFGWDGGYHTIEEGGVTRRSFLGRVYPHLILLANSSAVKTRLGLKPQGYRTMPPKVGFSLRCWLAPSIDGGAIRVYRSISLISIRGLV
jgi:hypothetical protein